MSMVQDGHQLQSEIKTPTGSHVLVDYSAGTYGDFLRYFISATFNFAPAQHAEIICNPSLSFAIIFDKYFFFISLIF